MTDLSLAGLGLALRPLLASLTLDLFLRSSPPSRFSPAALDLLQIPRQDLAARCEQDEQAQARVTQMLSRDRGMDAGSRVAGKGKGESFGGFSRSFLGSWRDGSDCEKVSRDTPSALQRWLTILITENEHQRALLSYLLNSSLSGHPSYSAWTTPTRGSSMCSSAEWLSS